MEINHFMKLINSFDEIRENDEFYLKDSANIFDYYILIKKGKDMITLKGDKEGKPFEIERNIFETFAKYHQLYK